MTSKTLDEVVQSIFDQMDSANCKDVIAFVLEEEKHTKDSTLIFTLQDGSEFKLRSSAAHIFSQTFHNAFGRSVRNDLNLWADESAELRSDIWESMSDDDRDYFNNFWSSTTNVEKSPYQGENMHADDASSIIMQTLWNKVYKAYS